jgi:hypothetical protein
MRALRFPEGKKIRNEMKICMITRPDANIFRARAIISCIAFDTLRVKGIDIARQLNVTPAAVSRLAAKGRTNPLTGEIEEILLEK